MDQLVNISDSTIRDWMIVVSILGIGSFIFIKWFINRLDTLKEKDSDRNENQNSKIEKYLTEELKVAREEIKRYTIEHTKVTNDHMDLLKEHSKTKMQILNLLNRVRYLEKLLADSKVSYAPMMGNDYE